MIAIKIFQPDRELKNLMLSFFLKYFQKISGWKISGKQYHPPPLREPLDPGTTFEESFRILLIVHSIGIHNSKTLRIFS